MVATQSTDDDEFVSDSEVEGMPEAPFYIGPPDIILLATRSNESKAAFERLARTDVRFVVRPAPDRRHPAVRWGDRTFSGLKAIDHFAEVNERALALVHEMVERDVADGRVTRDDSVADHMRRNQEWLLTKGGGILDEILNGTSPK